MIARLRFADGRCTGLEISLKHNNGGAATIKQVSIAELVNYDLLSITDRMILDKLAARVDQLARLLGTPEAAS